MKLVTYDLEEGADHCWAMAPPGQPVWPIYALVRGQDCVLAFGKLFACDVDVALMASRGELLAQPSDLLLPSRHTCYKAMTHLYTALENGGQALVGATRHSNARGTYYSVQRLDVLANGSVFVATSSVYNLEAAVDKKLKQEMQVLAGMPAVVVPGLAFTTAAEKCLAEAQQEKEARKSALVEHAREHMHEVSNSEFATLFSAHLKG